MKEELKPKERNVRVKYAVGLILLHKLDQRKCVVTGWDVGKTKTYYDVLCDDGETNFISEGNLLGSLGIILIFALLI